MLSWSHQQRGGPVDGAQAQSELLRQIASANATAEVAFVHLAGRTVGLSFCGLQWRPLVLEALRDEVVACEEARLRH